MSSLLPALLALLALLARPGAAGPLHSRMLKENIQLLEQAQAAQVSCDKMNVTDIFAGDKTNDTMELLCKASTVAWESRNCHKQLEGIYVNLLRLVGDSSPHLKAPCPVAAGNTTSLRNFLGDLHRVHQRLFKM